MKRCDWVGSDELYIKYHDEEWGKPIKDDSVLFEFLLLEGFQAGLSWLIILRKREEFRKAFDNFDYKKISQYNDKKLEELSNNPGIVRNKLKIKAAVINAEKFQEIQEEFGSFSNYIWKFVSDKPLINHRQSIREIPASTELSDNISKDLKKRGFKFVGTTIIYAFMQAVGIVNDHVVDCICYPE